MINKFKVVVYESTGKSYQDLFMKIMKLYDPDFREIKPHGNIGDGGNDGWIPQKGVYFQVYAPENLEKNINLAIKKLKDDVDKIRQNWEEMSPIRVFIYVINDKYNGIPRPLWKAMYEIQAKYKIDRVDIMGAKELYSCFSDLKEEYKYSIICHEYRRKNQGKPNRKNNDSVFNYWYDTVKPKAMTCNKNYILENQDTIQFLTTFLQSLNSFCISSYDFLKTESSNSADTELISAIMDFRQIACDMINYCNKFETCNDSKSNITKYWISHDKELDCRLKKVQVLKEIFYYLVMFSNRIIYIKNNICPSGEIIQYIEYKEDEYSKAIIVGVDGEELFYTGLGNIEKSIVL